MQAPGKDSISFGSNRESSVWHNQDPPNTHNLSVTFQQIPPSSRTTYLEGSSMIRRIPAEKSSNEINKFMQKNLDVVCLLQAAQIKRLIQNLQEYQIKFKQLQSEPLNRQSYEIQIRELAETSHSLELSNEDMKYKSQKLRQFIMKQNVEIDKLTEELRKRQKMGTQIIMYKEEIVNYKNEISGCIEQLEGMRRKYEKAIQSLNKVFDDNQHLTNLSQQLSQENIQLKQEIEMLKEHIIQMTERKEVFEQERIREIQRMRESYEMKLYETTTFVNKEAEAQFNTEKIRLTQIIEKLKGDLSEGDRKIKIIQQRLITLGEENKKLIDQVQLGYKDLQEERNKINQERADFDQKFKLFGDQIQRLNAILAQKQTRIKAVLGEVERSRLSLVQLSKQKEHLSSVKDHLSMVVTQITQEKQSVEAVLHRTKEQLAYITKLKQEKHLGLEETRKHLEHFLEKENGYQITINDQERTITQQERVINDQQRAIQQLKAQIQDQSRRIEQLKIQSSEGTKIVEQLKGQNRGYLQEAKQLKQTIQMFQSKLSEILQTNSQASLSKEMIIRNYEEKIREYFELNLTIKKQFDQLKNQHESISQQNITLKQQITSVTSNLTSESSKQLSELQAKCKQLTKVNTLVEAKLKSLEREKQSIEKQLEKQIMFFMENNHKTETMLHEHNHSVEMINYQQQYTKNHGLLLKQIERLSKDFLNKQDELVAKQTVVERLQKQIKRLVQVVQNLEKQVRSYKEAVIVDISNQGHELRHITQSVEKLSLEKQLTLQNSQLHNHISALQENLSKANQTISECQEITHKSIQLTNQNVELKHRLDKVNSELAIYKNHTQTLEQTLNLIKVQYTTLVQEKQQLIKGLSEVGRPLYHQNEPLMRVVQEMPGKVHSEEESVVEKNVVHLLEQFRNFNESVMHILSQIQQKSNQNLQHFIQSQAKDPQVIIRQNQISQFPSSKQLSENRMSQFPSSNRLSENHMSQFPSSGKLQETTDYIHPNQSSIYNSKSSSVFPQNVSSISNNKDSHVFVQNQSNILPNPIQSETQMSFNPSKFLDATKIPEQNGSFKQFVGQLKQQIEVLQKRAIQAEQQIAIYKEKFIVLQMQTQHYEEKIRKNQISLSNSQVKLKELDHLSQTNSKLLQENKHMIDENEVLLQKLHQKELTIKQKEKMISDYNEKFITLSTHTDKFSTQLKSLEHENHQLNLRSNYLEKQAHELSIALELSQKQTVNLTEQLNHHKQQQLLLQSKTSTLEQSNYSYALELEKQKLTFGKVEVLNQELERLEKENLDLIEELDLCKFEICSDVSLERRNQELLTILVLTFAEIESLRSRVKEKDAELTTLRKSNLTSSKHQ